jgi:hypothetical protein
MAMLAAVGNYARNIVIVGRLFDAHGFLEGLGSGKGAGQDALSHWLRLSNQ